VRLDLSLAAAGTLAMCFQMAASVAQLGFGHLADRWRPRVLLLSGPVIAVAFLSFIGAATSIWSLIAILVLGGFGCAMFHPSAAALATRLGGERPGFAMSVYITGGTFGFAFGPLVFAPFADRYGIEWTPVLVVPGLILVALLLRRVPAFTAHSARAGGLRSLRPYLRPLGLLYAIVVLRTLAALSFATFMPVMLTRRGLSLSDAGAAIAAYLFASGVGGFFGGPAADRFGSRFVIAASLLMAAPFLAVAPFLSGWPFVIVLAVGGFFLQSTLPVNVTFGQALAPVSAATVSSIMMGFGWGSAGVSVPFVGLLADRIGVERTLSLMALAPIIGAVCTWPLPDRAAPHAPARPAETGVTEL